MNLFDRSLDRCRRDVGLLALLAIIGGSTAEAATTTNTFSVQMVVTAACTIGSATALDFGSHGLINLDVDSTSTISVQCTNSTPYNIGLNAGTTAGGAIALRLLVNGLSTIGYRLYSDVGRTSNWGNTVGVDTVAATGNGSSQNYTVYGRVPIQTSAAPGTYTDTVTVTVTY